MSNPAQLLALSRGQFHPLLRQLERELTRRAGSTRRIGFDGPARDETVRLRTASGSAFPAAEVAELKALDRPGDDGQHYQLSVAFMGLTGPSGVLPAHYSNTVSQRARFRDHAFGDFLTLFDHRLISLFHRAWAKYKPTLQLEGHCPRPALDPYTRAVDALSGQLPGQGHDARRYYGGHFARQVRSAAGLARLLQDHLGHPVEVESLVGQWLTLSHRDRTRIGSGRLGANHHLGAGVLTGRRVWNVDSRIAVHIGPVSHRQHRNLIPGSSGYKGLQALINAYVPPNLTVDVHFHLRDASERPAPLGRTLQLGRTGWLDSRRRPLGRCSIRVQQDAA